MTPLWMIMLAGLLGSSHCLGMCGGFAMIVGLRSGSLLTSLKSQLIYTSGRLASYATIGGLAGFAGRRIAEMLPRMINAPALLCLISGVFLIREGLYATGIFRRSVAGASSTACLMKPLFSTMLHSPGNVNTFTAGIVTGLLPCGLVYAFVSLAVSSADFLQGIAIMLAFGSGTIPLMVLAGCGSTFLNWTARQKLWKAAAWSVLVTGVLTLGRGASFIQWSPHSRPPTCPFCSQKTDEVPYSLPEARETGALSQLDSWVPLLIRLRSEVRSTSENTVELRNSIVKPDRKNNL